VDEERPSAVPLFTAADAAPNDAQVDASGEVLATGDDPFLSAPVTPFVAEEHAIVRVTLRADPDPARPPGPRYGEVFWAGPGKNFDQRASLRFVLFRDGLPHTYRVPCGLSRAYRGRVDRMRLDLPDREPGARYVLSGIALDP
jgi:hypothetical protein